MTIKIFEELEADFSLAMTKAKTALTPVRKTVENDTKAIASSAWSYIETNGLHDLYDIAVTIVGGAVAGTPWGVTLTAITAKATADGIQLLEGSEAIVAAAAQADLIAAGKLLPPASTAAA